MAAIWKSMRRRLAASPGEVHPKWNHSGGFFASKSVCDLSVSTDPWRQTLIKQPHSAISLLSQILFPSLLPMAPQTHLRHACLLVNEWLICCGMQACPGVILINLMRSLLLSLEKGVLKRLVNFHMLQEESVKGYSGFSSYLYALKDLNIQEGSGAELSSWISWLYSIRGAVISRF